MSSSYIINCVSNMYSLLILLVLLYIYQCSAFNPSTGVRMRSMKLKMQAPELDDKLKAKLETMVKDNKIMLFMKGNKLFPQCGFSNTACRILDAINVPYETVNVLEDDAVRNGIKVYSSWPTIPQLYVDGEFIGGTDIMIEMYQNGELAEMIEVSQAS